ncbi:MAG: glycosyltransferase family 9 protein, partial [Cyclobacteriaceae bacterium]
MSKPLRKILILRFSSIGDIVLTTPVIRNMKEQLIDTEIHYCTKGAYESILSKNPFIDKLHLLEDHMGKLIDQLRAEKFDYVVDLHNNLRTLRIRRALGVKSSSFNKLNKEKWLLVNLKIDKLPNKHIVDRYMDTVKELGVTNESRKLDYFIPDKDEVENDWLPEAFRKEYYAVVVGAKFATKRLPVERLIELCDRINKPIVLLGGPEDKKTGEEIESFFVRPANYEATEEKLVDLNKKAIVFNACGKFNLNQTASLIRDSKAVFTHDTGLMHI